MVPMTAQRMIDIHSNAARPFVKPMLAKAANTTRMLIRRQKRTSTRVGFSSRDRFGSWAKIRNSDECDKYGLVCLPMDRSSVENCSELGEVIAASRLVLHQRSCLRNRWTIRLS